MKIKKQSPSFQVDGRTTTCTIYYILVDDDGKELFWDVAQTSTTCAPEDTYNEELGKKIALSKTEKSIFTKVNKFNAKSSKFLAKLLKSYQFNEAKYHKALSKEEEYYKKLIGNETRN